MILLIPLLLNLCLAETIIKENDIPELKYLNQGVDPCQDFYEFSCGNFRDLHEDDSEPLVDHFTLEEDSMTRLGSRILSLEKSDDDPVSLKKAKAAFKSCMMPSRLESYEEQDSAKSFPEMQIIEEVGGMPLLSPDAPVGNIWNEIGEMVGKYGVQLIFQYAVARMNRSEALIFIQFDGLTNPTFVRPHKKTYDEVLEESFKETYSRIKRRSVAEQPFDIFLRNVAKNIAKVRDEEEIQEDLDATADFMRNLYSGGLVDDNYIPFNESLPTKLSQLQAWTDLQFQDNSLNWMEYLSKIFEPAGIDVNGDLPIYINYQQLKQFYGVLNLVAKTDPKVVKNFALLRVFLFLAQDSDSTTRQYFEDYYNAKGYKLYDREEYCTRKILDLTETASLDFAVAYAYDRYYFDPEKKRRAVDMVQKVHEAYKGVLETVEWMDEASRAAALEKLEDMKLFLGLPDFAQSASSLDKFYENLRVCEWDSYGNALRLRAFKQAYEFSSFKDVYERDFWDKSVFYVNAYYNAPFNRITMPLSIVEPPFFDANNPLISYSRLGSIFGHEITHGFDNTGQNYDVNGDSHSLWTDSTLKNFTAATDCFVNQYNQYYVPEIQKNIDGENTLNENIADNGGIKNSFKAFQKLVQEEGIRGDPLNKYTLEQLFFIGYGTLWCSYETVEYLQGLVTYPPDRFRIIGPLSNMKEFASAFNCPVGSPMNPVDKCAIW